MKIETANHSRYKYLGTTAEVLTMIFLSFIIANSTLSGVQSPLNVALMGALPPIYAGSVLAGSLIAYFTSSNFLNSAVMICAMLLVAGVRIFINKKIPNVYNAIITSLSMFGGGIVIFTATEQSSEVITIHICLSIITGLVQYFLAQLFYEDEYGFHINTDSLVSLSVGYVLLVSTFCSVALWNVNIGIALGVVAILSSAKVYGISWSGICGVLTTCGTLLYDSDLGFATIFFAVGGLACGIVKEHHRVFSAVFYFSINVIGLMLVGDVELFKLSISGVLVGTGLYLLIPSKWFVLDSSRLVLPYTVPDTSFLDTIEARLKYSVQTIKDVRLSTSGIANAMDRKFKPLDITEEVYSQVCAKCRNRAFCWDKHPQQTKESFETLKSCDCENISVADMPEFFNWCFKRMEVAEAFTTNAQRQELLAKNAIKSREEREVLYAQIRLAESVILSTMDSMLVRYRPKLEVAEDIIIYLKDRHIPYLSVSAYLNDLAKLTIEVYIREENVEYVTLEKPFSSIAERTMEYLNMVYIEDFYRVTFCEKRLYTMEVGTAQKVSKGGSICGDTADHYSDCYGNQYAILSDGMGRGNSASIDSQLAVRLFKKLTISGMETPNAMELLNSLIMTKSPEESFATLDVLKLDAYSGTADIYKAGATSTILKLGKDVRLIEGVSYPLGIMDELTIYNYKFNVNVGDTIVMLSDGVDESIYQYIKTVLVLDSSKTVDILAQNICETAFENYPNSSDDITVTVVRVV